MAVALTEYFQEQRRVYEQAALNTYNVVVSDDYPRPVGLWLVNVLVSEMVLMCMWPTCKEYQSSCIFMAGIEYMCAPPTEWIIMQYQ